MTKNETTQPIRVMMVDDHDMVRRGLAMFLAAFDDLILVGEASSGPEAVTLCPEINPDVVLMDLLMPDGGGIDAIRIIHQNWPNIQVLALTSYEDAALVRNSLQAGAIGYLLKNTSIDDLARAIRAAHAGKATLAPEAAQALIDIAVQPALPSYDLSERERQVLALVVNGLTNRQIAQQLKLSHSTVKFHVSHILAKLGAVSRAEAVSVALQHHLIDSK